MKNNPANLIQLGLETNTEALLDTKYYEGHIAAITYVSPFSLTFIIDFIIHFAELQMFSNY